MAANIIFLIVSICIVLLFMVFHEMLKPEEEPLRGFPWVRFAAWSTGLAVFIWCIVESMPNLIF